MPKVLKCDHQSCGREASEPDAGEWLRLESVGVDARALTDWREDLPLFFCSGACLRMFLTERNQR